MISGEAKLAGVMGWPIGHSLSPRLHGFWLDHHRIDGAYLPLAVAPENFADALRVLPQIGFRGANVTVPHKQAAFDAVDDASPTAKRLGAVNTIVFADDGRSHGDNTDGYGFMENLHANIPDLDLSGLPAAVLGAGGAARAVVAALQDAGVAEIRLFNRTVARAEALAQDLGGAITPLPWTALPSGLEDASVLINTTSLGMVGHDPLEVDISTLSGAAVVTDIVYNPLETDLLASARKAGYRVVDGLGMLLHQARPGFAAWFGVEPAVTPALRDFILAGRNE